MLDRLVASRPARTREGTATSAVVAVLLHGGLVTAAILATWPAPRQVAQTIILDEAPLYAPPSGAASRNRGAVPALPRHWQTPDPRSFSVPTPDVGPLPPLGIRESRWNGSRAGDLESGGVGSVLSGGAAPAGAPDGTVYWEGVVDEPPVLLTHPALEYPALQRAAGLEGVVVFEVVIDSTGIPEPASLRVIEASHRGFVAPASHVVLGARFRPGRVRGRPVRVLVRQPISFQISR